jgi:hypothetical protein
MPMQLCLSEGKVSIEYTTFLRIKVTTINKIYKLFDFVILTKNEMRIFSH